MARIAKQDSQSIDGEIDQGDKLPDELLQLIEIKRMDRQKRLDALSKIVAEKRDEAVKARKESGIERIWREDEEYYLGIDDENRANHPFTKSMTTEGGLTSNSVKDTPGKCTAFFNIIRQYVDNAAARMGDILLPAGDWNFHIKPTPVPDLDKIKGSTQAVVSPQGNTVTNQETGHPYTLGEFAASEMAESAEKVAKAETRIRDWLTECQYHAEVRKVIENAAKIGTGVLRGAYPEKKKTRVVMNGTLKISEEIIPSSKSIHPSNFYPDPNCGDNIQNGSYVIESDNISARQLRDLIGVPGYMEEAIKSVLLEGPNKTNIDQDGNTKPDGTTKNDDRFKIWYFFGDIDLNEVDALGIDKTKIKEGRDTVPGVVVLVNDTAIKGFLNPLDNGEFPYDVMPWQRVSDSVWGIGVARQGRVPQDMFNGASRVLMENMGLSGSPQVIIRQSAVVPVDGDWTLVRGKFWYATEEADARSVADVFTTVNIPTMQQELGAVIDRAEKNMATSTGMNEILMGQQISSNATATEIETTHRNASAFLRRIARIFDECITEPHIRRYYDWLLLHGEDDEKGDLMIEATGSTALVEREIQAGQVAQILQMAADPAYGMSRIKVKDELLRAWKFEPSKFDMDEKEKAAAAQQQPAPAPAVQAAQIRVASAEKIAQMENQTALQEDKSKTDRDTAYVQAETARDGANHEYDLQKLAVTRELALLQYANDKQVSLESVKAELAQTSMKLSVQSRLSSDALAIDAGKHTATIKADLHKHASKLSSDQVMAAPTEPQGRASPGQAFES